MRKKISVTAKVDVVLQPKDLPFWPRPPLVRPSRLPKLLHTYLGAHVSASLAKIWPCRSRWTTFTMKSSGHDIHWLAKKSRAPRTLCRLTLCAVWPPLDWIEEKAHIAFGTYRNPRLIQTPKPDSGNKTTAYDEPMDIGAVAAGLCFSQSRRECSSLPPNHTCHWNFKRITACTSEH